MKIVKFLCLYCGNRFKVWATSNHDLVDIKCHQCKEKTNIKMEKSLEGDTDYCGKDKSWEEKKKEETAGNVMDDDGWGMGID